MSIKQKLEAIAEERAWELCEYDHDRDKESYKKGASDMIDILLPLLTEAIEALETTKRQRTRGYPTYIEWEGIWTTSNRALNSINEKLEGMK